MDGCRIKSERGVLGIIWITLPFTFMMPMFRIMMIGPIIKSLIKKMNLPKQKVGMMMDISTESVIVLLPVATAFVGFMVSLVEGGISGIKFRYVRLSSILIKHYVQLLCDCDVIHRSPTDILAFF